MDVPCSGAPAGRKLAAAVTVGDGRAASMAQPGRNMGWWNESSKIPSGRESDPEGSSLENDEIKPIDWLVPVS